MAEWSQLPNELLQEIANRLESPFYLLRFRSVCSSWRFAVTPRPSRLTSRFPFLPNDGISENTWGFHLSKHGIYLVSSSETGTETSSDLWLIKIEENEPGRMHLLNPLSRSQITPLPEDFPKVFDFSNCRVRELGQAYVLHYVQFRPSVNALNDAGHLYMEKVVFMSLGSNGDDFALLTIHVSGKLVMFKSGDKRWTVIHDMPSLYDDVIIYKGSFYAVDYTGRAVLVGLSSNVSLVANPEFGGDKKFLVESSGELLMVDMYLSVVPEPNLDDDEDYQHSQFMGDKTVKFKVFKLDRERKKWVKMKNLGNRVLFLSDDCTFSTSAFDLYGCKNCIFFTDNFFYISGEDDEIFKSRAIGVYDLENGSIAPLADYPEYSKLFWPPPDWHKLMSSGVSASLRTSKLCVEFNRGSGLLSVHFGGVTLKHATGSILAVNPQIRRASLIRQGQGILMN
ncbi:hypothetical protein FNV43_RR21881 [Rhamnella rubrinervis]|uniref:F-box domain-containing protein n=1 Tax=Rhamnella rubrinervis TaxID=2594499 RepID=A0A8K0DPE2_9ROSA|nr:hypothetical protein FNV43_RR21881 [Rhamnella rubrinervis]